MQTIRIFTRGGRKVHQMSGAAGCIDEREAQRSFPEGEYLWMR